MQVKHFWATDARKVCSNLKSRMRATYISDARNLHAGNPSNLGLVAASMDLQRGGFSRFHGQLSRTEHFSKK